MKLIVGLGNPGSEYDKTRHNVGFMVLDYFARSNDWKEKYNAKYCIKTVNDQKIVLVKPLTYMNNSGLAVGQIARYYDISVRDILVIQDDLDLVIGKYKLKVNSSSGGHNGIKSIIASLGSQDFARLKIGIKDENKKDVIDFVLGKFSKKELELLENNYDLYDEIINSFINVGIDKTMNVYNRK